MQSTSGRYRLVEISVLNFKSIANAHVIVKAGMTVITGPNGSGKSNLIEAVAFALGVEIKELRVSTLQELCGHPNQRVSCELSFRCGQQILKVASAVQDGARVFSVNSTKASKEKLRQVLSYSLGFAKDSVCWFIGQSSVQRIVAASPLVLFSSLCFVAGTHQLQETRLRVEKELHGARGLLDQLMKLITAIESGYQSDCKLLEALRRSTALETDMATATKQCVAAEAEYQLVVELRQCMEVARLRVFIESCVEETAALQRVAVERESCEESEELRGLGETAVALRARIEADAQAAEEESQQLVLYQSECTELRRRGESRQSDATMRQSELQRLQRNTQTLERRLEVTAAGIDAAEERLRLLQSPGTSIDSIAEVTRDELRDAVEQSRNLITMLMTATAYWTQRTSQTDEITGRIDVTRARIKQQRADCEHSPPVSVEQYEAATRQLQDTSLAQNRSVECTRARSELESAASQLRLRGMQLMEAPIEGDLGFLADLVTPQVPPSSPCAPALMSLLGPFLQVRIVTTNAAATILMRCCKDLNLNCRIWVLDRLPEPRPEPGLVQLLKAHPDRITSPGALLQCDKKLSKAIHKVFAGWVVVADTSLVTTVIEQRLRCVTLDGNQHTVGSLKLHATTQTPSLTALLDYHLRLREYVLAGERLQEALDRQTQLEAEKRQYEAHTFQQREIQAGEVELQRLSAELEPIAAQVSELLDTMQQLRSELQEVEGFVKRKEEELAALGQLPSKVSLVAKEQRALRTAISEREGLLKSLENAYEAVRDAELALDGLSAELKAASDELKCLDEAVQAARQRVRELSASRAAVMKELRVVEEAYADLLSQGGRAAEELREVHVSIEAVRGKEADARSRVRELSGERGVADVEKVIRRKHGDAVLAAWKADINAQGAVCEEKVVNCKLSEEQLAAEYRAARRVIEEAMQATGEVDSSALEDTFTATVSSKKSKLDELKSKTSAVQGGIELLSTGLADVKRLMDDVHQTTYDKLRVRVKQYFGDLVPGRPADLVLSGARMEDGLEFVLLDSANKTLKSTKELSGGEKSLLGLSFIFASALYKRSPLYLLDEIDAALDESNIQLIATIVKKIFSDNQALCVSHHSQFHSKDFNNIPVSISKGCTKIG